LNETIRLNNRIACGMLRHIFTHVYFRVRYGRFMLILAALWALRKYPRVCTCSSLRIAAEFSTVMSFGNETLVVGCSAFIPLSFSSLYERERERDISQRLEFHYYVQRNRHVDSLLQSTKPGQCFHSPLPFLCFLLHRFLTSTASSKTAGLFLYAYLNNRKGQYRICIYFSSLSLCCVEFSSRRTEGTF
jgi:hypothetical protein